MDFDEFDKYDFIVNDAGDDAPRHMPRHNGGCCIVLMLAVALAAFAL